MYKINDRYYSFILFKIKKSFNTFCLLFFFFFSLSLRKYVFFLINFKWILFLSFFLAILKKNGIFVLKFYVANWLQISEYVCGVFRVNLYCLYYGIFCIKWCCLVTLQDRQSICKIWPILICDKQAMEILLLNMLTVIHFLIIQEVECWAALAVSN